MITSNNKKGFGQILIFFRPFLDHFGHFQALDFVLELEEDLDLVVPPCSAVQEVGVLPGDGVDSLLVDDDDAMVP